MQSGTARSPRSLRRRTSRVRNSQRNTTTLCWKASTSDLLGPGEKSKESGHPMRNDLALLTKSIYEPQEESDGTRVLITRFYPRGVKKDRFDRWVRELSPSSELLHAYKSGVKSWETFAAEFKTQLDANPLSMLAIRSLREESRKGNVTLLCY